MSHIQKTSKLFAGLVVVLTPLFCTMDIEFSVHMRTIPYWNVIFAQTINVKFSITCVENLLFLLLLK